MGWPTLCGVISAACSELDAIEQLIDLVRL
jgi:hypothetical protein